MIQIVWVESRETVEATAFLVIEFCLPTHFLHPDFGIHTIQNRSGMGHQGARKSLKVPYLHNNPNNSKSSCPQGHVGSNPTRCAKMNEGRSIEQLNWTVQYFYPYSIAKRLVLSDFFYDS